MTQSCDFRLLGANMAVSLERDEKDLIADSSNKLYSRSSCSSSTGRILFAISKPMPWLTGVPNYVQEKRKDAFIHTRRLFEDGMQEIARVSADYRQELASTPTSSKAKEYRDLISFIVGSLSCLKGSDNPFSYSEQLQKIDALFVRTTGDGIDIPTTHRVLTSLTTDFALKSVEGVLQIAYPMDVFRKLIESTPLTEHDKEEIMHWITVVNRKEERLTSRIIHRALRGIVEICLGDRATKEEVSEKVCTLEWFLFQGKCALIAAYDKFHEQWCDTLYAGKALDQEKKIILGEEVYYPPLFQLGLRLFWCQNAPEKMIMISNNYCSLGVWRASSFRMTTNSGSWAIPLLNVHHIDEEGRYFVVETVASSLLEVDVRKSKVDLIPFLSWLGEQSWTPRTLSLDQIFVNHEGALRTFVPFELKEAMPFSFAHIEEFVWECSHKDSGYFQLLMRASGLAKHLVAQWYQKVCRNFLREEGLLFTLEEYALQHNIPQKEQEKAQEVINLLKQTVSQLVTAFVSVSKKQGKQLETDPRKNIVEAVIAAQEKFGGYSLLAPDLVQTVSRMLKM